MKLHPGLARDFSFCRVATHPRWQLHDKLNFGLPIALLTWSHNAADVDGGPPSDVIQVLAKALVQDHRVSFLIADESLPSVAQLASSTAVQLAAARGIVSPLSARLLAEPTHWQWLSTRDGAVAATLFSQPGFDWTLQAQVVLLSAADAAAPVLTLELTQALWRGGSPEAVAALLAAGVDVVLRPGVDGAMLGAVGLQAGAVQRWLDAIREQSRQLRLALQEVQQTDLA